jgi:hypothetical protein
MYTLSRSLSFLKNVLNLQISGCENTRSKFAIGFANNLATREQSKQQQRVVAESIDNSTLNNTGDGAIADRVFSSVPAGKPIGESVTLLLPEFEFRKSEGR